ncbi:MAG: hypothetical protein ACFCUG_09510 [Thiotrichales bacterium]
MTFSRKLCCVALASLATLLPACGGGGGTSSETAGITVNLQARVAAPVAATVTNSEGVTILLQHGYLVLWSMELQRTCTDPAFVSVPLRVLDWLVPRAEAHAESTPTKLGVPHVINVLGPGPTARVLGELRPAAGDYCGLTVELIRADDDAVDLPKDVAMVNRLVYLAGTWQNGEGAPTPFEITISKSAIPARLLLRPALTLSSRNLHGETGVSIDPSRWFDGLDFNQLDTVTQQDLLLANIRASMTAL